MVQEKKYKFQSINKDGVISMSVTYPGPTALAIWYLGFYNDQPVEYKLHFEVTKAAVCDSVHMGTDCLHVAQSLEKHLDGTPIKNTIGRGEWQYYSFHLDPATASGVHMDVNVDPGKGKPPVVFFRVGNGPSENKQWGLRGCNVVCPPYTVKMFTYVARPAINWVVVHGPDDLENPIPYALSVKVDEHHHPVHEKDLSSGVELIL